MRWAVIGALVLVGGGIGIAIEIQNRRDVAAIVRVPRPLCRAGYIVCDTSDVTELDECVVFEEPFEFVCPELARYGSPTTTTFVDNLCRVLESDSRTMTVERCLERVR